MKEEIKDSFVNIFGADSELLISAPGRINLIGEHTDYNMGFVLPAAIDKYIHFALGKSDQNRIEIYSKDFQDRLTYNLINHNSSKNDTWAKYANAIIDLMREGGHQLGSFKVVFGGDIPVGAGMSSSAALCCGLIYGISQLFELNISRKEIALLAQAAEHRIGLNCGIMDQFAVLFGQENKALFLDCQTQNIELFEMNIEEHSFLLINSMVQHELAAESGYNDRRASCENVVKIAKEHYAKEADKINSLRDIDMEQLLELKESLNPIDFKRSQYVLNENQRVLNFIKALGNNDLKEAGRILNVAQEGMKNEYEISIEEIDFLTEISRKQPGVLGSRMMGGGFGGCTINLIKNDKIDSIKMKISEAYQNKYKKLPEFYQLNSGMGVS